MRRAFIGSFALVGMLVVGACGSFLEAPADPSADGGTALEGGLDAADATANGGGDGGTLVLPRLPTDCPVTDCPTDAGCYDDDCDKIPGDVPPFGTGLATATDDGECTAAAVDANPTGKALSLPRPSTRTHVVLAFQAISVNAQDRAIASIAIDQKEGEERFVVVARSGGFQLCERNAGFEGCAPRLAVKVPQTMHLYGVVTSDDPPNAAFVLSAEECTSGTALAATRPFPAGNVRGAVGCLEGTAQCTMKFTDTVLHVTPD